VLEHTLSRYDGQEVWETSKLQNRRPLFDVELYLTVHKSFVSMRLLLFQKSLKQGGISYIVKIFLSPSLLILCLAGSIRNAGGYVWAYNTQPYFDKYYPDVNLGYWMSWIPLVGGSMGVLLGGVISDQVIKNRGLYARVWVLVFSQVRKIQCICL
jgi:hypothetical protein